MSVFLTMEDVVRSVSIQLEAITVPVTLDTNLLVKIVMVTMTYEVIII